MNYQRQQPPGCGGCLLILLLIVFVTGGAPALVSFLGTLIYTGLFSVLLFIALFWGFTYWMRRQVATYEQSQTETHNHFVTLLVRILVHIAKIDGRVSREEVQTIHRFFQYSLRYNQTQMLWVKELIKEANSLDLSLESLLQEFKASFAFEPRLILLELIYQIIFTKAQVPSQELEMARRIAAYLDIPLYTQQTMEAKYRYRGGQPGASGVDPAEQHYAVLGLQKGADMEEIKKAYRKLSMQYHPDKVRHLGEEFRAVAEEKMKEINQAYDFFKKQAAG